MMRALGMLAGGVLLLPLHAGRASLVETEVSHLAMLGHVAEMHLRTGSREGGVCPPEVVISLTRMGDPLVPRPEAYALSPRGPAGSLGMTLTPLRFCGRGGLQVSWFDLDMAYETSEGSSGTALQVGVLKAGFAF